MWPFFAERRRIRAEPGTLSTRTESFDEIEIRSERKAGTKPDPDRTFL
jgi:hypothetical protein